MSLRRSLYLQFGLAFLPLVVLIAYLYAAALVFLGVSGFLGGMLAYRYGVRVAAESDQAEGYRSRAGNGSVRR